MANETILTFLSEGKGIGSDWKSEEPLAKPILK